MLRSLWSGVSGLTTHQMEMDVIGNNIANVNTTAYKSQATGFSDVLYQQLSKYRLHMQIISVLVVLKGIVFQWIR